MPKWECGFFLWTTSRFMSILEIVLLKFQSDEPGWEYLFTLTSRVHAAWLIWSWAYNMGSPCCGKRKKYMQYPDAWHQDPLQSSVHTVPDVITESLNSAASWLPTWLSLSPRYIHQLWDLPLIQACARKFVVSRFEIVCCTAFSPRSSARMTLKTPEPDTTSRLFSVGPWGLKDTCTCKLHASLFWE